jgi:hypothetical protein
VAESKNKKKGYSPACSNEGIHGVCNKPRIKCVECPNQAFLPVTPEAILDHLQGRQVIGVYPMLARMFERRLRGYRAMGYREQDDAG